MRSRISGVADGLTMLEPTVGRLRNRLAALIGAALCCAAIGAQAEPESWGLPSPPLRTTYCGKTRVASKYVAHLRVWKTRVGHPTDQLRCARARAIIRRWAPAAQAPPGWTCYWHRRTVHCSAGFSLGWRIRAK
jgi:hypothetical protein